MNHHLHLGLILLCVLALEASVVPAMAATGNSVSENEFELVIRDYGGAESHMPLEKAAFSVTCVGSRTPDGAWKSLLPGVVISDQQIGDSTFAERVRAEAVKNKLPAMTVSTDEKGEARLSGIDAGLYLISPVKTPEGWETTEPFFVELPQKDGDHNARTLVVEPKNTKKKKVTVSGAKLKVTPKPAHDKAKTAGVVKTGDYADFWAMIFLVGSSFAVLCAAFVRMHTRR